MSYLEHVRGVVPALILWNNVTVKRILSRLPFTEILETSHRTQNLLI